MSELKLEKNSILCCWKKKKTPNNQNDSWSFSCINVIDNSTTGNTEKELNFRILAATAILCLRCFQSILSVFHDVLHKWLHKMCLEFDLHCFLSFKSWNN